MTGLDTHEDLVPLRTDFDRSWRGYDTRQVREYVARVELDLRLVISDRNAAAASAEDLARQLEELRCENDRLREKVDRVSRSPIEADGLSERLLRMVELAEDEAAEITERARAAAERSWAAAEHSAQRLRERHERLVAEVDARRREAAAEHEDLMRRTRAQVEEMTSEAARRRHKLDEQATRRRQGVEQDFEEAMTVRRTNAMQAIAEQERQAKAKAEKTVAEANENATRLLNEAQCKVDALDALRRRTADQLHTTQKLLADATPMLQDDPSPQEDSAPRMEIVPEPRKEPAKAG
jgi:DivIVA domain-containing protein